jgi:hypothetical protein
MTIPNFKESWPTASMIRREALLHWERELVHHQSIFRASQSHRDRKELISAWLHLLAKTSDLCETLLIHSRLPQHLKKTARQTQALVTSSLLNTPDPSTWYRIHSPKIRLLIAATKNIPPMN